MSDTDLRRKDRLMKRRYFQFGVWTCAAILLAVSVLGVLLVATGSDARPFAAILPFFYVPVLIGGVGWLAWTTLAPARRSKKR